MTEMDSEKLDELLSCYVDGELSDRRRTEVKRLMEHDPTIEVKLARLRAMKSLFNELPIEQAPADMFEQTRVLLERKCILSDHSASSGELEGARHLMFRRLITAAIILVLFGGLVGVVVNIMLPSASESSNIAAVEPTGLPMPSVSPAASIGNFAVAGAKPIFSVALDLATSNPIQMNSLLTKALHNNDLLGSAEPPRPDDPRHTTVIQCSKSKVMALLSDLKGEWDRCDYVTLIVDDYRANSDVVVRNVTCDQVMRVFKRDRINNRVELARAFSDFNALAPRRAVGNDFASLREEIAPDGVPLKLAPVMPELTSGSALHEASDDLKNEEKIKIIVTITHLR